MVEASTLQGRYRLEERLAAGGMGAVWRATDERLGRRVAVKLLRPELAHDPRFVERFRREARAVAALGHPHIANVFDYGQDDERHFIVMELVQGRDLARVLREENLLAPPRAAHITSQVCDALGHAHAAGVVHRDVKPANIIVGDKDGVKVTDFGIARAGADSTLTAAGSVLGTAQYISPEQAAGENVGPGSDLYSLGIVMFEMLTGTVPFTGDSPIAIAMRHVSEQVPPPSSVKPDVGPEMDAIVARATAKDPQERFPDAAAMDRALAGASDPAASTARLGGMAPTAPLGERTAAMGTPAPATAEGPGTVWPIPGDGWNARRVGRGVLVAFLLLAVIAAGLLLWRLASGIEAPGAAPDRPQQPRREQPPPQEETTTVTVPEVVGSNYEDAVAVLADAGLSAARQDEFSDEAPETVIAADPPPGDEVTEGSTVTLVVSRGPEAAPPEEGGNDDSSGPGSGDEPPGQEKKEDEGGKGKD